MQSVREYNIQPHTKTPSLMLPSKSLAALCYRPIKAELARKRLPGLKVRTDTLPSGSL